MEKKKEEIKILALKAIPLIIMFIMLLAAIFLWLRHDTLFAWFANNKNVNSNGMTIECDDKSLQLDSLISVVSSVGSRKIENFYYISDKKGNYYQVASDNSDAADFAGKIDGIDYYFIKNSDGSYVPIDLAGLFPGEKLTITLSFTNKTKRSLPYRLVLEDFDDSNDGTFIVPNGEENTPGTYSIMGIFFAKLESINGIPANTEGKFLSEYDTVNGKSINLDEFAIAIGDIEASETVSCAFSMTIDISQYRKLIGVYENLLSKKGFTVGALRLSTNAK